MSEARPESRIREPLARATATKAGVARRAGPGAGASRQPGVETDAEMALGLGRDVLLQHTALAGFRHHAAPRVWPALRRRTPLTLRREPDNGYDPNAVALYWRGEKLGYLPRGENLVAARLLDRQRNLSARVESIEPAATFNQRIRLAVLMH